MATATSRPPGLRGYDARWSDATGTALILPNGFTKGFPYLDVREFGNLSEANDNSAVFAAAVSGAPNGMTVMIPLGTWPGSITINRNFFRLTGVSRPSYYAGNLIGGTILLGGIVVGAIGVDIGHLGCQQTATADTDGLAGGYGDNSLQLGNIYHDLSFVGRGGASGSAHGVIQQGGLDVRFDRISSYGYTHGAALRADFSSMDTMYAEDCDSTSFILKSGAENNLIGCRASNLLARAVTAGKAATLYIEGSSTGLTTNNCVDGFRSIGSDISAVIFAGTAGTCRNNSVSNAHVYGCSAEKAFAFNGGDSATVVNGHVYDAPQYSFDSSGGATNTHLLNCMSRGPTSGHRRGDFTVSQINGEHLGRPGSVEFAPFTLQQAVALMTTPANGALEFDGTELYVTVGGARFSIDRTAV